MSGAISIKACRFNELQQVDVIVLHNMCVHIFFSVLLNELHVVCLYVCF